MERDLEKIPANFRQVSIVSDDPFFSDWAKKFLRSSNVVNVLEKPMISNMLFDEIRNLNGFVFVHEGALSSIAEKIREDRPSNIPQKISENSPLIIFSQKNHHSWPTHRFPYFGLDGSRMTGKDCLKIDALMYDILEQQGLVQSKAPANASFAAKESVQVLRQIAAELRDMRLNSTSDIIQNIEKVADDVEGYKETDPALSRVQSIIVSAMEVLAGKTGGKLMVIAIATSLFTALGVNSNLALGLSAAVMLGPDAVKQFFKDIKKNLEKGHSAE